MANMNPIISANELLALKENGHDFLLFDASNEPDAKNRYLNNHLENAFFIAINTELAEIDEDLAKGGRHPLPKIENFIDVLRKFGVTTESHIVIYDYKSGANAAARFWWMLKAIGHQKVQVLDGGFQLAEQAGYPINATIPPIQASNYPFVSNWILPQVNLEEVEKSSLKKDINIVDVRETTRYNGEQEPIDLIAGHIPNAVNFPFANHLNANGSFKSKAEISAIYGQLFNGQNPENIIVHCGSGVTACHTLLALAIANFKLPNLYVGSWSEWSRNNKPVATKLNK